MLGRLSYVIGLEVFDIFVNSFRQLGETGGCLKIGCLYEGSPGSNLLTSFVKPFPEIKYFYVKASPSNKNVKQMLLSH